MHAVRWRRDRERVTVDDRFLSGSYEWRQLRQRGIGDSRGALRIFARRNRRAKGAAGFRFLLCDAPLRWKQQRWLPEISHNAFAVTRLRSNRKCFSDNEFASIGGCVQPHARNKGQRTVNFLPLPLEASSEGHHGSRRLRRNGRPRYFIDLL